MRTFVRAVFTALALAAVGATALAQSPPPRPAAFSAHAHLNVSVIPTGGTSVGAAVRLAILHSDPLVRIDVLDVRSDSFPLPPIRATAVFDRRTNTLTIWNDQTKRWWQTTVRAPALAHGATPSPAPSRSPSAGRRVFSLADFDLFEFTMKLTGHGAVAGMPATAFSYDARMRMRSQSEPMHVTATMQLADTMFIPLAAELTTSLPSPSAPTVSLSYAVDDVGRSASTATAFTVPAGYRRSASPGDVLGFGAGTRRPIPPRPTAMPSATASPAP